MGSHVNPWGSQNTIGLRSKEKIHNGQNQTKCLQADRQENGQIERQMGRQTGWQTDICEKRRTDGQIDRHRNTNRWTVTARDSSQTSFV